MASYHHSLKIITIFSLSFLCLVSGKLSVDYYQNTCSNVEAIVRGVTHKTTLVPTALKYFYYDCFLSGCDASVLLGLPGNVESYDDHRPEAVFNIINDVQVAINTVSNCKNKVSCADMLALVARDVVVLSGGPNYKVELGRRDGLVRTDLSTNPQGIPSSYANLDNLTSIFGANGLSLTDMVALSGAHTIGTSLCSRLYFRLYRWGNNSLQGVPMNQTYLENLRSKCPEDPETDQTNIVVNLDLVTPTKFDNQYYLNLFKDMGTLSSDQVLYDDTRSRKLVAHFGDDSIAFNKAFVSAMTKLGRIKVLTGSQGQIRLNCTLVNN